MAKIPFDIKYKPQIESGEYRVVTASNYPVRILKWDAKNSCAPIIFSYIDGVGEYCAQTSGRDLFIIIPEPELSEFEKAVIDYKYGGHDFSLFDPGYFAKARNEAARLLELARKEIVDEWGKGSRDTQDRSGKAYNDGYNLGYERGKAEAWKDLPRWKKDDSIEAKQYITVGKNGERFHYKGHSLLISDLTKLPGFKED